MKQSVAKEIVRASEELNLSGSIQQNDLAGMGPGFTGITPVLCFDDIGHYAASVGRAVQQSDDPDEIIEEVTICEHRVHLTTKTLTIY